ncbi:MAG: transposase, partial [Deltaproteobacteria bacterium]|nr:transposase [Deltaproteobacteria bacterium]
PLGKALLYERTSKRKRVSYSVRKYRCKSFRECPYRDVCSKDPYGRIIERGPYDDAIKRQIKKQKNPLKRELLSRRKLIVDPVFGWIKHNLGIRRWSYRGLESVEAQWNLICSSINLKKLYNKWLERDLSFS